MILRPKNTKTILLALVSLAFVIMGLFISNAEPLKGWLITLFFGLCLLVFIIQIIPGSTQLKLTEKGFTLTSLFRSHFTKWADIKHFKIGNLGPNKTVVFDFIEGYKKHTIGQSISKKISGNHGALPATYGLKVAELLAVMQEWKNKCG